MAIETWFAFVAASTLLLLVPGPTILLVMSYALSQGRKVALATVAGVALGDFIAMSASLAGLGALVLASASLFTVLKWIGAAYLVYLGIGLLRNASAVTLAEIKPEKKITAQSVFTHATMVTALNPKSIVFFIAFVPQFIATAEPLGPQFAILITTFVTLAAINALAYALLADGLRARIEKPATLRWLTRMGGATLIAMGLAAALVRRANA